MTALSWVLVAIALAGTVFNVLRDRRGFALWSVSNFGLAGWNAVIGQWAQATLFAVYLGLSVWGWVAWRKG